MPMVMEGMPVRTSVTKRTSGTQPAGSVLGQVDPRANADRQPHHGGHGQEDQRADYGVGHAAARLSHRLRKVGEEVQVQGRPALDQHVSQHAEEERRRRRVPRDRPSITALTSLRRRCDCRPPAGRLVRQGRVPTGICSAVASAHVLLPSGRRPLARPATGPARSAPG